MQLKMKIKAWGGRRKGAGRKRSHPKVGGHGTRERVSPNKPVLITIRIADGLGSLRSRGMLEAFSCGMESAKEKGLRVQQYSLQSNHLHMMAEADNNEALASGVQSIEATLTHAIKKEVPKAKKIFAGRYHTRVIKSARQMKNALRYVVYNTAKHVSGQIKFVCDAFSSIAAIAKDFGVEEKIKDLPSWSSEVARRTTPARSWLQRRGWWSV